MAEYPIRKYRGLLLAGLVLCAWQPAAVAAGPELQGEFTVVAIRKASDVAGRPEDPSLGAVGPGSVVRFGPSLHWLWAEPCAHWSLEALDEPVAWVGDPLLSDTQVTAARLDEQLADHRLNQHLALHCGDEPIAHLLRVDRRVLVAPSPSGRSHLVLEGPLDDTAVLAVQQALKSMKFHHAEPSGSMDDATRRSLAIFASYLGADYEFNATAVTENLLEALGLPALLMTRPAWTDDQVAEEMRRYRFLQPTSEAGHAWVVVSGFFEIEEWPDPGTGLAPESPPARQRLAEIRAFLEALPNLAWSTLAERLVLLETERHGDWECADGIACYTRGLVVAIGPLEPEQGQEICGLLRANGWFCARP